MNITPEQIEQLGLLVDKAENYAGASKLPMPAAFHVPQLRRGLEEIASEIKALVVAITGENPWSEKAE